MKGPRPAPGEHARAITAWGVAAPLLALAAVAIGLPFAWRTVAAAGPCLAGAGGDCALQTMAEDGDYGAALWTTAWVSAASTAIALVLGTFAAVAIAARPAWRGVASVLASLGANLAGVPLALALTLLFGVQGVATGLLARAGVPLPFDLQGTSGLLVAYLCFQVPLATLLMMPALALADASLPEAAATLGASRARYWRQVGLPLLGPSLLEAGSLLFANAAAAYATPFALSGTAANVMAVRIASLVSGDIFADPALATLLALALFAMLALVIAAGRALSTRWRRRLLA